MSVKPALNLPGFCDGIDVSSVQTIADPAAVYAAGFRFAFVKVSEGLRGRDPKARAHLDALAGAGLHVGAYGFARFSQGSPRDQAKLAYETATSDGKHMVRVALDLENCPKGTPWAALTDFAEEYLSELRLTGGEPLLYTMASWVGPLGAASMGVPVWIAQYRSVTQAWAPASEADMPKAYPWKVLQYSGDHGFRVPGIPVDCDRNLFRGSEEDLRDWFGLPPLG